MDKWEARKYEPEYRRMIADIRIKIMRLDHKADKKEIEKLNEKILVLEEIRKQVGLDMLGEEGKRTQRYCKLMNQIKENYSGTEESINFILQNMDSEIEEVKEEKEKIDTKKLKKEEIER